MKKNNLLLFALIYLFVFLNANNLEAQDLTKTTSEKFLENVKKETELSNEKLKKEISGLKKQIDVIDQDLVNSKSSKKEISSLKSRIKILEEIEENKLKQKKNILAENYNSAIINLLALKKDTEPLNLYNSTRSFYQSLEQVSNPTKYKDYNNWLIKYKDYLDRNKTSDVMINMASELINNSNILNNSTLNLGPFADIILSSITKFIESLGIGKSKKELRNQSTKMFKLLVLLKNFESEKALLDKKLNELTNELSSLEKNQENLISETQKFTELNKSKMNKFYFNNTDANENFKYLGRLSDHINKSINDNEFDKQIIHNHMYAIQSLKINFGELLEEFKFNLMEYKRLTEKYKKEKTLDFSIIDKNYKNLEKIFNDKFDGTKYKSDAVRMYQIE